MLAAPEPHCWRRNGCSLGITKQDDGTPLRIGTRRSILDRRLSLRHVSHRGRGGDVYLPGQRRDPVDVQRDGTKLGMVRASGTST